MPEEYNFTMLYLVVFQFFCGLSTFAAHGLPELDMGYRHLMNLRILKTGLGHVFYESDSQNSSGSKPWILLPISCVGNTQLHCIFFSQCMLVVHSTSVCSSDTVSRRTWHYYYQ